MILRAEVLLGLKLDFLNLLLSSLSVINSYKIGSKSRSWGGGCLGLADKGCYVS